MLGYVNERFNFYKRMENPVLKDFVSKTYMKILNKLVLIYLVKTSPQTLTFRDKIRI